MPEKVLPFQKIQYEFTSYIRDPEHRTPPPGVEKRRIDMYRELIFNNVDDVLANCFPVLKKITDPDRWKAMVSDFLGTHKSHSPYFVEIPKEFLEYLQIERGEHPEDPPFMLELAHYEWIEMDVNYSTNDPPGINSASDSDPLSERYFLSKVARLLAYEFPVQKICPEFIPKKKSEALTQLIVYRDSEDEVRFLEINSITYRLVQLITETEGRSGTELISTIVDETNHPNPQVVYSGGSKILRDLTERVIVGTLQ